MVCQGQVGCCDQQKEGGSGASVDVWRHPSSREAQTSGLLEQKRRPLL